MTPNDLKFTHNGVVGYLNPNLVAKQGLNQAELAALVASHVLKLQLFEKMRAADASDLLILAGEVEQLEYHQQSLWHFPRDIKFHGWFKVPRCSCDKDLGEALQGLTTLRIVHEDCPVHHMLTFLGGQTRKLAVPAGHWTIDIAQAL